MSNKAALVKKMQNKFGPKDPLRIRRGLVVSVGASTATIVLAGSTIAGVPFYAHVTGLAAGSKVDVLLDGETPVIIGELA